LARRCGPRPVRPLYARRGEHRRIDHDPNDPRPAFAIDKRGAAETRPSSKQRFVQKATFARDSSQQSGKRGSGPRGGGKELSIFGKFRVCVIEVLAPIA